MCYNDDITSQPPPLGESQSLQQRPSPEPLNIGYNLSPHLSNHKTTVDVSIIDDKSIFKGGHVAVCPKCFTRGMIKFGSYGSHQRWRCSHCGYTTISPRQRVPKGKGGKVS